MRAVIIGLATSLFAGQAIAADYLRGSSWEGPPPARSSYDWSGLYFGGQVGYAETSVGFAGATRSMTANLLRGLTIENEARVSEWPSLPRRDARDASYGGFIGYNAQWGQVVLGIEGNYNRTSITTASSDVIGRRYTTSDSIVYDGLITSNASMRVTDYGTLRFRAGYAWDWIMPYLFVGAAFGRADVSRSVNVDFDLYNSPGAPADYLYSVSYADAETKNGAFAYGYAVGGGIDVGITHNVFLRGEYEFVQLSTIKSMSAHINTFRAAAAVKF